MREEEKTRYGVRNWSNLIFSIWKRRPFVSCRLGCCCAAEMFNSLPAIPMFFLLSSFSVGYGFCLFCCVCVYVSVKYDRNNSVSTESGLCIISHFSFLFVCLFCFDLSSISVSKIYYLCVLYHVNKTDTSILV